jgi:hypothetical protein
VKSLAAVAFQLRGWRVVRRRHSSGLGDVLLAAWASELRCERAMIRFVNRMSRQRVIDGEVGRVTQENGHGGKSVRKDVFIASG